MTNIHRSYLSACRCEIRGTRMRVLVVEDHPPCARSSLATFEIAVSPWAQSELNVTSVSCQVERA
jgi:hypothetical protein